MEQPALTVENLTKAYRTYPALDNISFTLPQGKIIGLLGPNGSGKTTLLKSIAGLLHPTCGTIRVCGMPIGPETKAIVSFLPDRLCFSQRQTVSQLMDYFSDFYRDFDREVAERLLSQLKIHKTLPLREMSKGAQEKIHLVLTMSRRAKLYLLDEPMGGIDPATREFMLSTILQSFDPQSTVLISTHLIADVEQSLDDFIFLHKGRIVRQGNADEVRAETGKSLDELFREVFKCL